MALRCGIVGLPNVGKSTLFNALTAASVPAENYPFCTIEPNAGIVAVPDARLAALDAIVHSARVLPATVELVDIAGLVRGASKGEGLGNQFLAHIRETNAIVMVLRCFEDPDVTHVDGAVDPLRDAATIDTELALADLDTVERRLERVRRSAKTPGKEGEAAKAELALLEGLSAHLSGGEPARSYAVPDDVRPAFRDLHLLTAKPVLYVANVDESGLHESPHAEKVERFAAERGAVSVRLCAKLEAELAELAAEEKTVFLAELGLEEPGLDRLARAAYALLDLITFFTAGPKEVRAWTIRRGTAAPQAAGEIHTDFERTFIRAEVIAYDDYVACGGEVGARAKGKMRVEGKEYVIQDGDVLHFRVGA
jgi:GTP-binding protein YchF